MANDVSIKFGVEGEKQLKDALKTIGAQTTSLKTEFSTLVKELATTEDREGQLAKISENLTKREDELNKKLELQTKALEDAKNAGNLSAEAQAKMETAINRTKGEIADVHKYQKDLNEETGKFADKTKEAANSASIFGQVLSAEIVSEAIIAGVKKLAEGIKEIATASAEAADSIQTLSSITGMSTDTIQEFKYMADLVDVSFETISGSMKRLTKSMNTAKDGTGDAAEAFDALGIQVTRADGSLRSNQDVFYEVITALGKMENQTQADAYAMSIFGKSAQDLNPLIDAGTEKMKALAQEAHNVGYVLDGDALEANQAYQDSLDRMSKRMEGLKNIIGTAFAPALESIVNLFADIVGAIASFIQQNEWLQPVIAGLTTALIALAAALGIAVLIKGVAAAFGILNGVLAMLAANAIVLVIAGITALVVALVSAYKTNDEFRKRINDAWGNIKDFVSQAIEGIKAAIETIKELPAKALEWGKDLIDSFVQGIKDKVGAVRDAVSNVAQTVKDYLGFSEPSKGALSNFHTFAPDMIDLFAKGMENGIGTIANASNRVANAVALDAGSVQAIADYGNASNSRMVIEVPLYINGKQFAKATYNDYVQEGIRKGEAMGAMI